MQTISLCMIVKNEEQVLNRCLASVRDAIDEIIVADTGSGDATKEIAAAFGAQVFDFPWIDDFSAARNFSFDQAHGDYLLWLDADDVIPDTEIPKLLALKHILGPQDMVMLPYRVSFDSGGRCTMWYYRERLLRRAAEFRFTGFVHEAIVPRGQVEYGDAAIEHRKPPREGSDRNLRLYECALERNYPLTARDEYYYARELSDHGRHADAAAWYERFLLRPDGWIEDRRSAYLQLAGCKETLQDENGRLQALVQSVSLGAPRAEACCELGRFWLDKNDPQAAAFWYRAALEAPRPTHGFVSEDCYSFIPSTWLCVCYDRLGDRRSAQAWNDRARQYKPDHPSVLYNDRYFADLSAAEENR